MKVLVQQQVTPDPRPQETHEYPDRSRQAPVRYGIDEYVSIVTSDDQLNDNYPIEPSTLEEANTVATPAAVSVQLQKDDSVSKAVEANRYQSMFGSLLYVAVATRPDIAQAVGAVAKFMKSDGGELVDTPAQSGLEMWMIVIQQLEVCSSWQEDTVSWLSKKQPVSTSEAEYVALSMASQEAVRFLSGLTPAEVAIMEDNQGTIAIARNPVAHAIRYHNIREAVQEGTLTKKLVGDFQPAD